MEAVAEVQDWVREFAGAAAAQATQASQGFWLGFFQNPTAHVTTRTSVTDPHVTVAAPGMAEQGMQTFMLDQVPAAQAAVHTVMVPATAGGPAAALIPTVFFGVAVAHTFVVPVIRESVAEVHVSATEACD